MQNESSPTRRPTPYSILLHIALIGQAVLVLTLVQQNRQLRELVPRPPGALEVGTTPQPVALRDLEGAEEALTWTELERDRLLVVFTTNCGVCKDSLPSWRTLAEEAGEQTEIVGISLDDAEATRAYSNDHDLPFRVRIPVDGEAFARDYEIPGVPTLLHVDRQGVVQGSWVGGLSDEAMIDLKDRLTQRRVASL